MLRLITDRDGPLSGRASLYNDARELASAEAHALTDHVRFGVSLDADNSSIHFSAAAGPYLAIKIPISDRLRARLADVFLRGIPHREYDDVDVFEVSLHHGGIWWSIGHTTDAWSSTTPRWRSGSWNAVEALLGKEAHDRKVLSEHEVDVSMPEGTYRWKVSLVELTVKRSRWPWPKTYRTVDAKALDGQQIPIPGKGESAHDCDDDALYAVSGEGRSVADGIAKIVGSVMRSRLKYGGSITMPRTKAPTRALDSSPIAPEGYRFTPLTDGYVDIAPPTGLPIMWWPGAPEPEHLADHKAAFRFAAWLSSLATQGSAQVRKTA